jgi:hypothetical protein
MTYRAALRCFCDDANEFMKTNDLGIVAGGCSRALITPDWEGRELLPIGARMMVSGA